MNPGAGTVVASRYRLERHLADGGMGTVWVARHIELDVEVAIKFMAEDFVDDAVGQQRFKREARAAALLKSPHVTHIHDYGLFEGAPYMVMELLDGVALDEHLDEVGRLDVDATIHILRQLAAGLTTAHDAGIVHRDLKPSNIFLTSVGAQPFAKILDFGIAKETKAKLVAGVTTETGTLIGSPRYMSPEQALGEPIDHRSDLWSLGIVAYEMLTGHCPYDEDHLGKLIRAITTAPVPPLADYGCALPGVLDAFFRRALAKLPEERFSSGVELVAAFETAAMESTEVPRTVVPSSPGSDRIDGNDVTVAQAPARGRTGEKGDTVLAATVDEPPALAKPTRPRLLTAVMIGVVAIVIALGYRAVIRGDEPVESQPSPETRSDSPRKRPAAAPTTSPVGASATDHAASPTTSASTAHPPEAVPRRVNPPTPPRPSRPKPAPPPRPKPTPKLDPLSGLPI